MTERRKFSRVMYRVPAILKQNEQQWHAQVLDLSLKGVLLSRPENWQADPEHNAFLLVFYLHDSDVELDMDCILVNNCENYLHLYIDHIDIDSASHLKRLVELNVGNDELLHRELAQLTDHMAEPNA
ncbi:PilZ domain-containing protein [Salinivibrio sp. MA351]|jgi:PilZ domain.|uniref:Cyclic diguanosine monophosphate-binding protein n=1 Tax=Salinivibrio costicola subsp. alcaliphilus TaxID=272773 RepID=A0ABX3KN94_SALCS|nr:MULTISPECIES: PilZ domain-containing protein [Salinivibrio]OOE89576.1 PilZ domain-containing protein [Salinivibrio sp. AR647]OOE90398.1 PilZ domain-containing protein [Salinivibrio sp. AR640]OOE96956.1 PilZ domain-containing protein [Salinivibrio sp. MA351]OOE97499.1 PilZ domain-containing protein [Salinivibrio sp. IB643]OOF02899.1 PilZ domain-containing protein [Salinivibrio sp. MA607]